MSWLDFVNGRRSILFALLAGVSIGLLSEGVGVTSGMPIVWARMRILVRAVVIFALGWLLSMLGTPGRGRARGLRRAVRSTASIPRLVAPPTAHSRRWARARLPDGRDRGDGHPVALQPRKQPCGRRRSRHATGMDLVTDLP